MHSVNHINGQFNISEKSRAFYSSINSRIAEFLWQSARYLNLSEDNLRQVIDAKFIDNRIPEKNS